MRKSAYIALIFVFIFIAIAEISFPFVGRGGGYTLIASTIGVTGGRNASGGGYNMTFTSETAFVHNITNSAQNFSIGYIHMLDSLTSIIKTLLTRESNRSLSAIWLTDSFGDYNLTFTAPSTTGTYIIKINATWSGAIPGEQLATLNVKNTQTISLAAGGAFIVKDASGASLAVLDSVGNLNIKGTRTQNAEPTADTNDFAVQNSSGGLNLVITNPEGNLLIKNYLNESQASPLSPTLSSFVIQNSTGRTVAYVNSTGGLFLTGTLTENVLFS